MRSDGFVIHEAVQEQLRVDVAAVPALLSVHRQVYYCKNAAVRREPAGDPVSWIERGEGAEREADDCFKTVNLETRPHVSATEFKRLNVAGVQLPEPGAGERDGQQRWGRFK